MLVMTMLMGISMSAVFTWQTHGFTADFLSIWAGRFITTWPIVIPIVLVRRQINMDRCLLELREALAHLSYDVKRRSCGEASALI
jgi:hypothetical protein